jgi:ElaB/YqjD/DUF883 family membrane-anchored ribosome-binding protein
MNYAQCHQTWCHASGSPAPARPQIYDAGVEKRPPPYEIEIQEDPPMRNSPTDSDTLDLEHLKQEFNRFRSELGDRMGQNATEALAQMSAYLEGGNLASRVGSLESEFANLTGRLKGTSKDAVEKLGHEIETRPFTSLALAFGVGVVAAQLLRRSSQTMQRR